LKVIRIIKILHLPWLQRIGSIMCKIGVGTYLEHKSKPDYVLNYFNKMIDFGFESDSGISEILNLTSLLKKILHSLTKDVYKYFYKVLVPWQKMAVNIPPIYEEKKIVWTLDSISFNEKEFHIPSIEHPTGDRNVNGL
jgi:hypothetical protein